MKLFEKLFKKNKKNTSLEKFKTIKIKAKKHTEFLMSPDFKGLDPELVANKTLYQVMDKEIRKTLTPEQNIEYLKIEEKKNFLEALKKEVTAGKITNNEIAEILELKEYKEYMKS